MLLNKSNISKYLEKKDTSYKIFNIKYTQKEQEAIDNFNISNENFFTYFGKMNENIIGTSYNNNNKTKINILEFLTKIGTNTTKEERELKYKYYCKKCDYGINNEAIYKKHLECKKHIVMSQL
jgi:hypothetical protein